MHDDEQCNEAGEDVLGCTALNLAKSIASLRRMDVSAYLLNVAGIGHGSRTCLHAHEGRVSEKAGCTERTDHLLQMHTQIDRCTHTFTDGQMNRHK